MTRGNWWEERNAGRARRLDPARGTMTTDAVVVGGGIAGLAAARQLRERGLDVVLLEAETCGAGATGRSSGFMTPDSELTLRALVRRLGRDAAATLWRAAQGACDDVRADAAAFGASATSCDVIDADSLWVASTKQQARALQAEHDARRDVGFASEMLDAPAIGRVLGAAPFVAGVRVPQTFGIDAFAYAAALRDELVRNGLRCFESSRVVDAEANVVRTATAEVRAEIVLFCVDRYAEQLGVVARDTYHAQAFLTVTEPLTEPQWASIFPAGPLLVWDSSLVYHYFRRIGDGRLLVGGGRLLATFSHEQQHGRSFGDLERYVRKCFPVLEKTAFTNAWCGLLGISKDLLPIAGPRPGVPSHHVAMCSAGLPWSILAGRCAADLATGRPNKLAPLFAPSRRFNGLAPLQPILGKPLTWALSYFLARR